MKRKFLRTVFLRPRRALLLGAVMAMAGAAPVQSMETHGLLSFEDYHINDSSAQDINLFTTRLKLDLDKLNSANTLSFHFDGRQRVRLAGDYSSSIPDTRVETLDMEYSGGNYFIGAGRLRPKEFPVEHVDGVNLVLKRKDRGIGTFAGLKPDPYTESFNSSFATAGLYGYYNNENLNANLGFVHDTYKLKTDRQYFYSQATYVNAKGITLLGTTTLDLDKSDGSLSLTNTIAELSYRPDGRKGVIVGYNQFKAYRYYESLTYEFVDSRQKGYYIGGNYRLFEKLNLYGRLELQIRDYPSIEDRYRHAYIYRTGFNIDNLARNVNMDFNFTLEDSYGSKHNYYRLEFSRLNWDILQVNVSGNYRQNQYGTVNSDNVWGVGFSGALYLKKKWTLLFSYDREQGRQYTTNILMSRIGFRF